MTSKKLVSMIIVACSIILSFTIGYFLGKQHNSQNYSESFYANVLSNETDTLHIEGIPENDINHRGEFLIAHKNIDEVFNIKNDKISIVDIQKGSQIRVVYDGMIMESYPAQIPHVLRIEQIE